MQGHDAQWLDEIDAAFYSRNKVLLKLFDACMVSLDAF